MKHPRLIMFIVGGFVVVFCIAIIGAFVEPEQPQTAQKQPVVAAVASSSVRSRAPVVFDIPALIGKDITQIKAALGKPIDDLKMNDTLHYMTFSKDGQELSFNYDAKTKAVQSIFFDADDASGQKQSKELLLDRGNLSENDSRYKVEVMTTGFNIRTVEIAQQEQERQKQYEEAMKYTSQVQKCAKDYITNNLKAPSTAKFPWDLKTAYDTKTGKYTVLSYVDSQNGFGAMIRTNFLCEITVDQQHTTCNGQCKLLE